MGLRSLMWILWPSFLAAAVGSAIVFALIDPLDVAVFGYVPTGRAPQTSPCPHRPDNATLQDARSPSRRASRWRATSMRPRESVGVAEGCALYTY